MPAGAHVSRSLRSNFGGPKEVSAESSWLVSEKVLARIITNDQFRIMLLLSYRRPSGWNRIELHPAVEACLGWM